MTAKFPTFSPADSALLLIDHQTGTMQLIKTMPLEVAKRNTLALAKTAMRRRRPFGRTKDEAASRSPRPAESSCRPLSMQRSHRRS